jgi:hypothetical protein
LKYSLLILSILMLSACGGGSSSSSNHVSGDIATPATASISANPLIVMVEESTKITWSSTNTSSCTASGAWSGDKLTSGSESIVMNDFGDQRFTLTCGSATTSITVTVNSDHS